MIAIVAIVVIIVGLYALARAVRNASTDQRNIPGGDDQKNGMYK